MKERQQSEADDSILQGVAEGIEHAMEHCITKYGGLVWSIAKRHVRDHSSAEDVVQETFTDLWKSAKRFDPAIATECTFIGMLARRRAIDFARRESRRPKLEPLPDSESIPHASSDASAATRCDGSQVRAALRELPSETQQILALHFDEGMTHPEIAERTGLPLGTVKTRLRRGLMQARDILRRLEGASTSATTSS